VTYDITKGLAESLTTIDTGCYDGARLSQVVAQLARFYYDTMRSVNPDLYYGLSEEEDWFAALNRAVVGWENLALMARTFTEQAVEVAQ
jgi:hypothetical protein